ncbi:hypothetical protein [Streptomyces sp. NBC_00140]|uniref:hypothetical protein n=1 Tax=Streptomyces sp. NBC_00140 TaxID=2975664 RepID=UPI0022563A04|nr:hypothetical protein [Streptomyces sp. NBC_00140]MCX5336889.1 hypothetical protein [Streptomyces sp. NBC_00140]MCX5338372.1 hypothetical protein [Streptomyces sp. NBC_00140]
MLTLRIQQMAINGTPYLCPECASEAFTLDGTGWIDAFPVRGNCWQSHSWEEPLITLGGLKQVQAASTGRFKAGDIDTFAVVIGGALLEGVIQPEVLLDDLKKVAKELYWKRIIKPAFRRRKRAAVRAVTRPVRTARRAAGAAATDTVAAAKASAIGAAWDWQTPGGDPDPDYKPDPMTSCAACDGKGIFNIDSRVHELATARCSACSGTGQID